MENNTTQKSTALNFFIETEDSEQMSQSCITSGGHKQPKLLQQIKNLFKII